MKIFYFGMYELHLKQKLEENSEPLIPILKKTKVKISFQIQKLEKEQ
jgi:hypothetical protein